MDLQKIIYDLGMNYGNNIPYYLEKADRVVAVEANPELCTIVGKKFHRETESGRLKIVNCAVTPDSKVSKIDFYVHLNNSLLSQIHAPSKDSASHFKKIEVPASRISDIIKAYGEPYYIKVDIEGCDHLILRNLLEEKIIPKFISAEAHTIEVFALLIAMGYRSFNLVDGVTVSSRYANSKITTLQGQRTMSFGAHTAGPFGEDLKDPWQNMDNFFECLSHCKLGWKDIHATNAIPFSKDKVSKILWHPKGRDLLNSLKLQMLDFVPTMRLSVRKKFRGME